MQPQMVQNKHEHDPGNNGKDGQLCEGVGGGSLTWRRSSTFCSSWRGMKRNGPGMGQEVGSSEDKVDWEVGKEALANGACARAQMGEVGG